MKKLGLIIGLSSIFVLTSCSNSANETTPEGAGTENHGTTTTTKSDDGTTINIDKDGFELGNKDGGSETNVKVSTDSVRLKVK